MFYIFVTLPYPNKSLKNLLVIHILFPIHIDRASLVPWYIFCIILWKKNICKIFLLKIQIYWIGANMHSVATKRELHYKNTSVFYWAPLLKGREASSTTWLEFLLQIYSYIINVALIIIEDFIIIFNFEISIDLIKLFFYLGYIFFF